MVGYVLISRFAYTSYYLLPGEIFKITVLGQQIVFIGSAALCEEICGEKCFRKFVGRPIVEIRYAVHDSLFTAFDNEPSWGIHHRILAPLLNPKTVADYFTEVRDCASELTAKGRSISVDAPAKVSAIGELNRLDIETITLCFYGRKLKGLTGLEPPMIKAMDGATSEAIKRPTRPWIVNWLFHQSKTQGIPKPCANTQPTASRTERPTPPTKWTCCTP